MSERFDVVVVGAGMIGACAAWHLASRGISVALVGPGEPADRSNHAGVFASYYDQGRITRIIDPDPVWARLAAVSIARYRELESASGIAFYREAGCLRIAAAGDERLVAAAETGTVLGADYVCLDSIELRRRLPYLVIPDDIAGLLETHRAGHLNPRALVAAARIAAAAGGCRLVPAEVQAMDARPTGCRVVLADGTTIDANRVLIATGAFSVESRILPRRLRLAIEPRTAVRFACDGAAVSTLADMPSLITSVCGDDSSISLYAVPPVTYSDGRLWLKAGTGAFAHKLDTEHGVEEIKAWFRGEGREDEVTYVRRCVETLLPSLRGVATVCEPCVITATPTGYPYIGLIDGRTGVAVGGNGYAAKSCIELGRIAGDMIIDGSIADAELAGIFAPRFAA